MKLPSMNPIASSQLSAWGHENGTLFLTFNSGATYAYDGVTPDQLAEFEAAESKGSWFHQNLRNNADHPARRVESDEG